MSNGKVEFLHINAVNSGFRDVTITGLAWRILWPRKRVFIVFSNNPLSSKVPAKLTYGDEVSFLFPVAEFPEQANRLLKELRTRYLPLALRRMRAGVYTSTGEEFLVPLDNYMRKWLREQAGQLALDSK